MHEHMSFFRRLSLRRRSRRGRRASCPPGIQLTTASDADGETYQPLGDGHRPSTSATNEGGLVGTDSRPNTAADAHAAAIDVYESRIDELGQLMAEQGRCLDEVTNRSNRLSFENTRLRETVLKERMSKQALASSTPKRGPLKSIINHQAQKSVEEQALVHKLKEENALLHQQAELLAAEATDANKLIAERDASIATLGKELSSCVEKARLLMVEKSTWKSDMSQKTREVEALEAEAKRSSTLHAEITSRAEQYLSERKALEAEVTDLGAQMSHLSATVEGLQSQLASKQGQLDKQSEELGKLQSNLSSAKHEAKANAETTRALQDTLRRAKQQSNQLEQKLADTRDQLADTQISRHKLQTTNDGLQAEIKAMVEQHKAQISSWSKGQSELAATLEGQYQEEAMAQQKQIDNLRRLNATLESDGAQYKRDLQSCEQRCTALEHLLASKESAHRDALKELLSRATEAEARVDVGLSCQAELKAKICAQNEKLAALQIEKKETDAHHGQAMGDLQRKLLATKEKNEAFSTRIPQLEEEAEKAKQLRLKERQKLLEETEQKVREANVECEALRVAMKNEKMKRQEAEDLLGQQELLHQSTLDTLKTEKNDLALKMERLASNEREVGKRLMAKVQELNSHVQTLTAEKLQLTHQLNKHVDQIYHLEKIISSGEQKLSQFAKQLGRSMEDQERRITREVQLKRELHSVRVELEKARRNA